MKAVKIFDNVQNYINRNHNLYMMWGGLFAGLFFFLYMPLALYNVAVDQLEEEQRANAALVAQVDSMNNRMQFLELSYDKKVKVMREVECLAKNIYFEAGSEPYNGKLAVAQVTVNRAQSGDFPHSICGVVYQKTNSTCQFSWVCEGKNHPGNNASWKESVKIAESILINKRRYDVVGQAKYFHATYVAPAWSETKSLVRQIGNHIFYR